MFRDCLQGGSNGPEKWSNSTETRPELERLRQMDLNYSLSGFIQCLELHTDPFVDIAQKLHVDHELRWRLRSSHRLTEKRPFAQVLLRTGSTTNLTETDWLGRCLSGFINKVCGVFLSEA